MSCPGLASLHHVEAQPLFHCWQPQSQAELNDKIVWMGYDMVGDEILLHD